MRPLAAFVLLGLAAAPLAADERTARREHRLGRRAAAEGRMLDAWLHFSRARAEAPGDRRYIEAALSLQPAAAQALAQAGVRLSAPAPEEGEAEAPPAPDEPRPERPLREPVRLRPDNVRTDFRFRGTVRDAYREIAERFGLRALFDEGFERVGEREIRFDLDDADFDTAAVALGDIARAFYVPVGERMIFVAEDTAAKRTELEPVATATIDVAEGLSEQGLQELVQAVQQTLDIKRLLPSAGGRAVALRDTPRKLDLARMLFASASLGQGEIVAEVDLIAVNRDRTRTLGARLPSTYPVANFSTVWNAAPPELTDESAARTIALGGGRTVFGVSVGGASLAATLARGEGALLQRVRLRAAHGTEAKLSIGERFPIVTARFEGPVDQPGEVFRPFPSFTFEELGLTLTLTPTVHGARDATLAIKAEFKTLAGGSVNGIPILANRTIESQVRVEDSEPAVIGGMSVAESRTNRTGLAGLSEIPLLGRLFRQNTARLNVAELIVVVRPRIVRLPPAEAAPALTVRFGPEERPLPAATAP